MIVSHLCLVSLISLLCAIRVFWFNFYCHVWSNQTNQTWLYCFAKGIYFSFSDILRLILKKIFLTVWRIKITFKVFFTITRRHFCTQLNFCWLLMHGSIFFTVTSHCSFQFFGCIMRFTHFTFSSGYMSFMRITNCFIGFKSSCLVPGVSASFSCVLTRLTIESLQKLQEQTHLVVYQVE